MFYSDKDLQHLEETVNQELGEINTWLCANKLSGSEPEKFFQVSVPVVLRPHLHYLPLQLTFIDKTHFVIFHPYQKKLNHSMKIKIDGKTINEHKSVKYLGILIWKEHPTTFKKNI